MAECQEEVTQENVSDEVKTKSCDSCSFRGVGNPADTYCPVCSEYLCISCVEIHNSLKATREHELVQIEKSTKTLDRMKVRVTNKMKCDIHWSETVREFCLTHEKVICHPCKTTKHRNCDTSALAEVAEKRQERITRFLEDIKVLASEFEKIECSGQEDRKNVLKISESLAAKVETIKEEIVTWAEKLKQDALEQIEKNADELLSNVNSRIAVAKEMRSMLTTVNKSFEKLGNDRLSDSFVLMTKTQQQIREGTELKQEIEKEIKPPNFNFYRSTKLSKFMSDISSLGTVETDEYCFPNFLHLSKLTKKQGIAVESSCVTGCVFMSNGQLVICDHINHTVKVLTSEFKLRNELMLNSHVWDIAILSADEIIVTEPYLACLDVINVSETIRKMKSIPVSEQCWGVDINKDNIFVSCHLNNGKGGNIRVLTLDGLCLNTFRIDEGNPFYLAVNDAADRIIVCTHSPSKVICIDMTGNTIFTYTDTEMKYTLGFLFDTRDNFMVCGRESNNVHVVKRDGTKHKILLSSDDGLYQPYCLAYRSIDKTLVVGQWATKSLTAFSIKN